MKVLWIHGWGMGPDVWRLAGVAERLPEMEHEAFGYAGCRTMEQARERLIERACRLAAEGPLLLAGWSLGGMLALEAAGAPQLEGRLRGLTLLAATLRFASADRDVGWPPRVLERMRRGLQTEPEETLARFRRLMFTAAEEGRSEAKALLSGRDAAGAGTPTGTDFTAEALDDGLIYLRDTDLRELWGSPRLAGLPTLWIHGGADAVCPPGAALAAAEPAGGRRRRVMLPEAGHAPFLSAPGAVFGAMKEFWHEQQQLG